MQKPKPTTIRVADAMTQAVYTVARETTGAIVVLPVREADAPPTVATTYLVAEVLEGVVYSHAVHVSLEGAVNHTDLIAERPTTLPVRHPEMPVALQDAVKELREDGHLLIP